MALRKKKSKKEKSSSKQGGGKFSKLTSLIMGGGSSERRKRRIGFSKVLLGGDEKKSSFLARQIQYWLRSPDVLNLNTTMTTTKTLYSSPTSSTTVTISFTPETSVDQDDSALTSTTEPTTRLSTQEISKLQSVHVFSANTKLVASALSVWYEIVTYLLTHHKRRIILQEDYYPEGGLLDYLARVKREEGWLALLGFKNAEKDFTASLLTIGAGMAFEKGIRAQIIDPLLDSENTSIPNVVKQLIAILELPLSIAMTYPFDHSQLVIVKKKIENGTIGTKESDKSLRCIPTLKQLYKDRGLVHGVYYGFGWHVLETVISNLVRSGLKYVTNLLLEKIVGTQNLEMAKSYLPGDQLFTLETTQNIGVEIAHEAITAPLHYTMTTYRADMGKTFSNPVECFRKIQTERGFTTFYKGVWLGTLFPSFGKRK
ncbi:hypothetical protein C9374_002165 [Naegleria lovaniensis]|uniref:Uncharacterized protein n=1 Tax=Naegleria lovaniensis TaxID=51637 RepID=A0AA88KKU1_NAELO|nr:uncharacterized protein C9374_002165 [Naegleria lovaniensis]KAG2387130.1 hypothetical protein C9374_002165 [Naegleria lovaniensis]